MKPIKPINDEDNGGFLLDDFKNTLKTEVDFILRPKTVADKEKILNLVMPKITNYSHQTFNEHSNPLFKHFVGHQVRKGFRKDLINFIKAYIQEELKKTNKQ